MAVIVHLNPVSRCGTHVFHLGVCRDGGDDRAFAGSGRAHVHVGGGSIVSHSAGGRGAAGGFGGTAAGRTRVLTGFILVIVRAYAVFMLVCRVAVVIVVSPG